MSWPSTATTRPSFNVVGLAGGSFPGLNFHDHTPDMVSFAGRIANVLSVASPRRVLTVFLIGSVTARPVMTIRLMATRLLDMVLLVSGLRRQTSSPTNWWGAMLNKCGENFSELTFSATAFAVNEAFDAGESFPGPPDQDPVDTLTIPMLRAVLGGEDQ